jgi:hypothetical protein
MLHSTQLTRSIYLSMPQEKLQYLLYIPLLASLFHYNYSIHIDFFLLPS